LGWLFWVRAVDEISGVSQCGKGALGWAAALRWGGRRVAPTALRCSVLRPRRRTRFVRCALSAQTAAPSRRLKRAARAAASPAVLGTPKARRSPPQRAFATCVFAFARKYNPSSARLAARGAGAFCGAEKRRERAGARSAHQRLTHRHCVSVESAANEASLAMRPGVEHRRGVGAQRRPPQQAPAPRAVRRAAHEAGTKHLARK
jgi:hypothetical protein